MDDTFQAVAESEYSFPKKIDRLINLYAFFMSFPVIVIYQNISSYIFIIILFALSASHKLYINTTAPVQKFAVLFGVGAVFSTISSYFIGGFESLSRSLVVLPNYLYWSLLILFLVTNRDRLNLNGIFKAITIGIVFSIIYYFFLQRSLIIRELGIFKVLTRNTFAFILICYVPIAVYYIKNILRPVFTILIVLLFALIGFLGGSRSGSILVLSGAVLSYLLTETLSKKRVIFIIVFFSLVGYTLTIPGTRDLIERLNPRTSKLIYSTENTIATDRSLLLRKAMVEKGLSLFRQHPVAGIGLNNFTSVAGEIEGNFEGARYIINKDIETGKSAHNSYIGILSEGGLLVAIPFFLILLWILLRFIIHFPQTRPQDRAIFIGVLMMAVHLYFISAILNVFAWYLIGLASGLMYWDKQERSAEELDILNDTK
jgi:O-antigen ligase